MIRLLIDGASDVTSAEALEHGWELIPISVTLDGEEVGELPFDGFYARLAASHGFPLTSQPSPHAFTGIFEEARDKGDQLVYLALSSRLSGTYQSALLARDIVGYDGIRIVDTRTATHAIHLLALEAQTMIEDGMALDEMVRHIERLKPKVRVIAALDTLEYLARGGRIPPSVAHLGDLARLKPVVSVSARGEVEVLAKGIGINRSLAQVAKLIGGRRVDPDHPILQIHTSGDENGERLARRLATMGIEADRTCQVGPTIGAHIGPGAAGLVFVSR